jgi:hypothetical protein
MKVPMDEFDGKVTYGQKRLQTGRLFYITCINFHEKYQYLKCFWNIHIKAILT